MYSKSRKKRGGYIVDGSEIRETQQLSLVGFYNYLQGLGYIPGGCWGFLNHQQEVVTFFFGFPC